MLSGQAPRPHASREDDGRKLAADRANVGVHRGSDPGLSGRNGRHEQTRRGGEGKPWTAPTAASPPNTCPPARCHKANDAIPAAMVTAPPTSTLSSNLLNDHCR